MTNRVNFDAGKRSKPITVVDARMGRGKSSAAIRYMNEHKGSKRFLYITPYLNEVDRVCEQCDFDQSESDFMSKSSELKLHLKDGKNIAATHSLFYLMDEEALELVREFGYSLIVDESIQVIERVNISDKDFTLLTERLTTENEFGVLRWIDKNYSGRFDDYKAMADVGSLCRIDSALLNVLSPDMLVAFDDVFMLTYLFEGQYQKAYLDFFGFDYQVIGVEHDEDGYYFSDKPDAPPPVDYRDLIKIVTDDKMNNVGRGKYSLSMKWYEHRGYNNAEIKLLRNNLRRFFESLTDSTSSTRLWTSFKRDRDKLTQKSGRFRGSFLYVSARATNEYRNRTAIAYLVNRFTDPNLMKFFISNGIALDQDKFALSEMLQWIWRSAIRDDKPINLYIPSKRMRDLLINWMNENSQGGQDIENSAET